MNSTNDNSRLWVEFEQQSIHSPGDDEVISACYGAVAEMAKGNHSWIYEFGDVMKERKIGYKHGVNLFFRSMQYILTFEEKDNHYPAKYKEKKHWIIQLPKLWEKHKSKLISFLKEKDTGTTIYQRYAGIKAILSLWKKNNAIDLIDLGCGGNHGIPGLINNEKFVRILDHSPKKIVSRTLKNNLQIVNAIGLDKYDPYDSEVARWRLACSFYPKELTNVKNFLKFERKLRSIGEKIFVKGDMRNVNELIDPRMKFDAVLLSTVLYQMNELDVKRVINAVTTLIKKEGLIIIQDFAKKNEHGQLDFEGSWFKEKFGYRTFVLSSKTDWKIWEILKWNNGRCHEVEVGEDWDKFFGIVNI